MWHRVWLRKRELVTRITYYVCWYGADGKQRSSLVGSDKRLAEDLRRKKELELNAGMAGEPVPISFEAFRKEHEHFTEGRVSPGTLASQLQSLERLRESAAPMRLSDIDWRAVEEFVAARSRTVRPATVNKDVRTLKAIFGKAVERGYLSENPFAGVPILREPERPIRILSLDEIEKVLAAAPSLRWRAFIYLALTAGMRVGELCHLTWDDVDLESGTVTIQNRDGWQTKSRKIRRLGLTVEAIRLLRQLRLAAPGETVFQTCNSEPLRNNIQRGFRAIVKKAGIKHCTMHDLRRTFVSYLAMAGVNEAIVQKLAGHASISTTLKHYTHILPESLRRAQDSLPYAKMGSQMLTLSVHAPNQGDSGRAEEVVSHSKKVS